MCKLQTNRFPKNLKDKSATCPNTGRGRPGGGNVRQTKDLTILFIFNDLQKSSMFSTTYVFAFPSPGAVRFAAVLEDYLYFVANKRFVAPPIIRRMIGAFDSLRSFALILLI